MYFADSLLYTIFAYEFDHQSWQLGGRRVFATKSAPAISGWFDSRRRRRFVERPNSTEHGTFATHRTYRLPHRRVAHRPAHKLRLRRTWTQCSFHNDGEPEHVARGTRARTARGGSSRRKNRCARHPRAQVPGFSYSSRRLLKDRRHMTPIELARIDTFAFRSPVEMPIRRSFGTFQDRPLVLVRVTDVDGAEGWGEVWSIGHRSARNIARAWLRPSG